MSEAKHTPGPWRVVVANKNRSFYSASVRAPHHTGRGNKCIARVLPIHPNHEANANLALILAAPEMLEALMDVRRALEIANFTGELAVVDAAIAKATQ